jgi:hypothetical protein
MGAILALGVAPAVVKAGSIMRVRPPTGWVESEWSLLLTGEIGRYEGVRFIENDMARLKGAPLFLVCGDSVRLRPDGASAIYVATRSIDLRTASADEIRGALIG